MTGEDREAHSIPRPRSRALIEGLLFGVVVVCLLLGMWALGFFREVSRENRALLIIASNLGLLVSFAGLVSLRIFYRWLGKRASQKILSAWQVCLQSKKPPRIDAAHYLSEGALRVLAIQLFTQIGYSLLNKAADDEASYIGMLNPDGELELIACEKQSAPLEIRPLYEFQMELKRAGAVRGYFWSVSGFTPEAVYWVREKSILLADRYGIGHLVDCVQAYRSRFLD